ncbi:ABC transporter ATP-binding protein [Synechococcus sp. Nb3U1]|uniref:ABC transporter ATP-binding protein n=1 Tax=Synechococcus sp. Nb3U1 TaxID=1914529 RepID=UPI001F47FCAC|nr:ABC transporter ATP-binding protein [Synechococcus sp. Nb3U1]MCF2970361.1 ABC transporter ATP-binding protein [Synechococcus sp. Nb3U1]
MKEGVTLLRAEHLTGGYGSQPVVRDLSLEVERGEWLSIVGPNGSGKSTLLRLLSRVLPPLSGRVELNGRDIHHRQLTPQQVAQQLALLPQQQRIPQGLTVRQLVSLGRSPHQRWWQWQLQRADWQRVNQALTQTGLGSLAERRLETLSGGERQRAFLALALVQEPQVLLLDEPTTFLDLRYQLELLELLQQLNQERGLTVITVLHDLNLATRYSQRIALLGSGQLQAMGSPREVLTPSRVAQVFGLEVEWILTPVGWQLCPLATVGASGESVPLSV